MTGPQYERVTTTPNWKPPSSIASTADAARRGCCGGVRAGAKTREVARRRSDARLDVTWPHDSEAEILVWRPYHRQP